MIARRKTKEEWKKHLADQRKSSQTALAWCKENGINYNTFIMHRMQQKKETAELPLDLTLFRELEGPVQPQFIEFIHRGTTLRLPETLDKKSVRQYLQILWSTSC